LDDFAHELVLVLTEHDGLVVFTGCSHQGILNMVEAVTQAFPGSPLKAVFGGFHLVILPTLNFMAGSRDEVRGIGIRMLEYPLECVYTGHCTGSHAFQVLKGAMGKKLEYIATGRCAGSRQQRRSAPWRADPQTDCPQVGDGDEEQGKFDLTVCETMPCGLTLG
jgi:metal-dependent hydrolase (beta-lactamase superfamily II)